jgi:NitT/TauT family transport system ATP-binding protein
VAETLVGPQPPAQAVARGIAARGVRKVYASGRGSVTAVDGIDFVARPGEFVSIVGPSGCGKSTFLHIIGGFVAATEGAVTVDGTPVRGPDPARGIVFQEFVLFPWKTVLGNAGYGLAERGVPRRERTERARRYIELVGLSGFERHYPKELSGGMKQRVALARSLIMDPAVLLMDEPFGSVDAQTRVLLQEELLRIWERTRKTVVFVTHSVDEALYLSDTVYVLSSRPARVNEVVAVDLPRPRDPEALLRMPAYRAMHERIWSLLHAELDAHGRG